MRELEGKKLLIIGGVRLACDIVKRAQEMGAYVIVADYDENSPAKKVADKAVLINALDVDALVNFCKEESVDGVTTGFVDILQPPCYEVCKRLGLPYYVTPKMLTMSTNKIEFKNTCDEYGVPVPQTYLVGNTIDDQLLNTINYPVFVKPLDGSGSRGAGVCYNQEELLSQFSEAVGYSASKNAIIEDYITGRDFLLDYIAVDGEFRLLSMFDRYVTPDRGSAVNYANVSMAPSKSIDLYLYDINEKVINMFKKLGFRDGLLFMQGYSDGKKITFFEMGCRLGGSFYNHERACLGMDAIEMTVRYALTGRMVDDIHSVKYDIARYDKFALDCNYLLKGYNETVADIKGIEDVKQMPSCISTIQYQEIGYHYDKDKIVDRPIFTASIVSNTAEDVKKDVSYINNIFDVLNTDGKSILLTKIDPESLF